MVDAKVIMQEAQITNLFFAQLARKFVAWNVAWIVFSIDVRSVTAPAVTRPPVSWLGLQYVPLEDVAMSLCVR